MKLKLRKLTCLRCGHNWVPRKPEVLQCPSCKSHQWNQVKKCYICGCTNDNACPGGCVWVESSPVDLCTSCQRKAKEGKKKEVEND